MSLEDGCQTMHNKQRRVPMSVEAVYFPEVFDLPVAMSLATQATAWYTRRREAAKQRKKKVNASIGYSIQNHIPSHRLPLHSRGAMT